MVLNLPPSALDVVNPLCLSVRDCLPVFVDEPESPVEPAFSCGVCVFLDFHFGELTLP